MDKRVLFGVAGFAVVILIAVVVLAASTGGDDDDDNDIADTPTPTAEMATTDDSDVAEADDQDQPDATDEDDAVTAPEPDDQADEEQPAPVEQEPVELGELGYGFNIAWRADEEGQEFNNRTRDVVREAGFDWVRFQIHWSEIQREPEWLDPLPVDRMLDVYEGTGMGVLVSIVGAPDWARDPNNEQLLADWESFVEIMAFLAGRYQGRIHAWEIWNEQNMAHEMGGTVRVSDYAHLLEAGYRGVKAANPEALVVFGGLTPTGINDPAVAVNDVLYLESFYNYGDGYYAQFFDIMGMHLNATNNPPDTMWPDNPGPGEWTEDGSFYFLRGTELRAVMNRYGDDRPAWITEFGWTTANQAPGYEYGVDVSEEDQARFLVDAFRVVDEQMPWVEGMFVWNLNFSTLVPPEDEKYPWSVLNSDWSPRPAFNALQEMPRR